MDFSQWLKREIEELEITNYELSKKAVVHQTTIANILNGGKPHGATEKKLRAAIEQFRSEKNPDPQTGAGMDDLTKDILSELEGMSDAELLLVKERIQKIKESRE